MRVFCHMVVGPGEADRYLGPVLDRARMWADYLHVTLDARASEEELAVVTFRADGWEQLSISWEDHEGRFRQEAWRMLELAGPTSEDFIVCLDADEVIVDHDIVKPAAREFPGHRIPFRFHEMWSKTEYRIDGHWKPYQASIMFPYRPKGYINDKALASGREPTYTRLLPEAKVVGDILHYGYARAEDRQYKYDRYMRLDGGRFHARSHLESIIADNPGLMRWEKGGLL